NTRAIKRLIAVLTGALTLTCADFSTAQAQTIFLSHSHAGGFTTSVNPALSLMNPEGTIALIVGQQWVGVEGDPKPFCGSGHLGLGRLGATTGLQFSQ